MEKEKLSLINNFDELEKANNLTPGAVLGIRRPYNFVEGEFPIYFEEGKGSRVIDIDGNEYIDFLCAYGPIIFGYRESEIDEAVISQIRDKGFCFSLTQKIQNKLSEKLIKLIPSAEMTVFLKTGSSAATLAVRTARSYTGKDKIMRCGYHGWHYWCSEVKGGIPKKLQEDVYEFEFNNLQSLEELFYHHAQDTAAVILTPIGHPLGHKIEEPEPDFLKGVRELTKKYNAVLIFDEIRTGFRISLGGAQKYYGVTPDLSLFGKAMANGYSIGALVGKEEIMREIEENVFVSSTFFPNSTSFAAALKTIEKMENEKTLELIWDKGRRFQTQLEKILSNYSIGAELAGIPPMPYITFKRDNENIYKSKRNDFYAQLIRRKVFMQPYHHGYICRRHSEEDLVYTLNAVEESLNYLENKY